MPVCKNCLAYILKGHFCCGICQFNYMRVNMPTPEELMSARGPIYGEARINLACTQELCDVFDKYVKLNGMIAYTPGLTAKVDIGNGLLDAHKAAIHLVLTKIARIASGAFHEDNYDDGATYFIIGKKIMKGESTLPTVEKELPQRHGVRLDKVEEVKVDKVFRKGEI